MSLLLKRTLQYTYLIQRLACFTFCFYMCVTLPSFSFLKIDSHKINKIKSLKVGKAPGAIILPQIQELIQILLKPVSKLINKIYETGIRSRAFRTAAIKIKHLHKNDKKSYQPKIINHRLCCKPISRTINVCKTVITRMTKYLYRHNVTLTCQFGFQRVKSTKNAIAITELLNKNVRCTEQSKTFTVHVNNSYQGILWTTKLFAQKWNPAYPDIFRLYLSARTQRVKIDNTLSIETTVSCKVA